MFTTKLKADRKSVKELLLEADQVTLWNQVFPGFVIGKKNITSPLRADRHTGSCEMKVSKEGIILFKDYAQRKSLNFVDFSIESGKTFKEAIDIVKGKIILPQERAKKPLPKPSESASITNNIVDWSAKHNAFWERLDVSQEVLDKYVRPIDFFSIKKSDFSMSRSVFGFIFIGDTEKIYIPYDRPKFVAKSVKLISHYENNKSNILFITKGWKDFITIRSHLDDSLDYIVPNSEYLTRGVIEKELGINLEKYMHIFVLFDTDKTGKENSRLFKDSCKGITCTILKVGAKDYTDSYTANKLEKTMLKLSVVNKTINLQCQT